MRNQYEDIINLPHHVSKKRPQMPIEDRAAQFSPFAALVGYDAAIQETQRLTEERTDLDEGVLEGLNSRFQILMEHLKEQPHISITYFKPDERKAGGSYVTVIGELKKVLEEEQQLLLKDGTKIPIQEITKLEGDLFLRGGLK